MEALASTPLPLVNLPPDLVPIPPTYPWMTRTLFAEDELQTAMYVAIKRALQTSGSLLKGESKELPPQPAQQTARRHGFPANMERHKAIAQIVSQRAPNWRKDFRSWKRLDVLHSICLDLDQALVQGERRLFDIPERWRTGRHALSKG